MRKWVEGFRTEGPAGLRDRCSRPHRLYCATPLAAVERIEALRRQRWTGQRVAAEQGVSPATVSRILKRLGLNAQSPRAGKFTRTGHRITGERKGQSSTRGVGWEFVHVCIDDASRVAFTRIMPDEKKESATAFLKAAIASYQSLGITVEQVMTDCPQGDALRQWILITLKRLCQNLQAPQTQARPNAPNHGKAERFIQTALREWAHAHAYDTSEQRAKNLPGWIHAYNWHRPHGSLNANTPISQLGRSEDNLLRLHT